MGFKEMIKRVQLKSGFSDSESKDALEHTVEVLAVHLTEGERKDFASQLPQELKDIALSVMPTEQIVKQDLFELFVSTGEVDEPRAKKQLLSAWEAIKDAVSPGQIQDVRAQLSKKTVVFLH